jgi:hypothetical protein
VEVGTKRKGWVRTFITIAKNAQFLDLADAFAKFVGEIGSCFDDKD